MKELIKNYYDLKEKFQDTDWQYEFLGLADRLGGDILGLSLIFISLGIGFFIGGKLVLPLITVTNSVENGGPLKAFLDRMEKFFDAVGLKLKQLDDWILNRRIYKKVKLVTIVFNLTRLFIRLIFVASGFVLYFGLITGLLFLPGLALGYFLNGVVFGFTHLGTKQLVPTVSLAYNRAIAFYTALGASPLLAKVWTFISGLLEAWGTFESAQSLRKGLQKWIKRPKK